MSRNLLSKAALGLALCLTGNATTAVASPITTRDDAEVQAKIDRVDAQLDQILSEMITRARNVNTDNVAALNEQFNKAKRALRQRADNAKLKFASAPTDAARLLRAIADLEERARLQTIEDNHVYHLRERLIDVRLDEAIEDLRMRASQADGNAAYIRARFTAIKAMLEARAAAAKEAIPEVANLRPRLSAIIDDLRARFERNEIEENDLYYARGMAVEARLDRALSFTQNVVKVKAQTTEPFMYLRDLINDAADVLVLVKPDTPLTLRQRWLAALTDLERQVAKGSITEAEFLAFREQLRNRAMAAAAQKLSRSR